MMFSECREIRPERLSDINDQGKCKRKCLFVFCLILMLIANITTRLLGSSQILFSIYLSFLQQTGEDLTCIKSTLSGNLIQV